MNAISQFWNENWVLSAWITGIILAGGPVVFFLTVQFQALVADFRASRVANGWARIRPWIGVLGWSGSLASVVASNQGNLNAAPHWLQVSIALASIIAGSSILAWSVATFVLVRNNFRTESIRLALLGLFFAVAGCMFSPCVFLVPESGYQQMTFGFLLLLVSICGSLSALLLWHIALAKHVGHLAAKAGKNPMPYILLSGFVFAPLAWVVAANLKPALPNPKG